MADFRERNWSLVGTPTRDDRGKRGPAVTHHRNILAMRTNLERLDAAAYLALDQDPKTKPIDFGVTVFRGLPNLGVDGKLLLDPAEYNLRLAPPQLRS